jgi:hypothetical protein
MANATGFSLFFKTNYTVADAKVSKKPTLRSLPAPHSHGRAAGGFSPRSGVMTLAVDLGPRKSAFN